MGDNMQNNVGSVDRIIRLILGAGLIVAGITQGMTWLAIVGAVPILTAVIGWCPAYLPFGIKTCKTK